YMLKANAGLGLNTHFDKPVRFPLGYTDAWIEPEQQRPRTSFQGNLMVLKALNDRFSIGVSGSYSTFGFVETGSELSFWTGTHTPYRKERAFEMYGLGLIAGVHIIKSDLSKLSAYTGLRYEEIIDSKGIYLWRESYNQDKFAAELLLEYGHKLARRLYLTIGLQSVLSLNDFYETIPYRPLRYGVSLGVEYEWGKAD
ncbi:MAG: hypothetical protein GVY26_20225, partial [Bacteroidetes bacterium]|nr:hypothetical protein [Bacteroidota bacterium]